MIKAYLEALLKAIFLYFKVFLRLFLMPQSLHVSLSIVVKNLWALLLLSYLFLDFLLLFEES